MNCRNSSTRSWRKLGWLKTGLFGVALGLFGTAQAQVVVTGATVGNGSYSTLGAAFAAINAGVETNTDNILIDIQGSTTETGAAVLNTNTWATLTIRPSATATINGSSTAATGRGVIEFNGADNVTLNGDIAGGSVGRDLTIINNNATGTANTSVVRVATATGNLSADNITISNCTLTGSATGRNGSGFTSTSGAENASYGVIVGPNGAVPPAAPTAITSVTGTMATSTTANAFVLNGCAINACARAVVFNGSATTSSTLVTITNNLIGDQTTLSGNPPFTSPTTTVYTKGIYIAGTTALTITGNSVRNILSYVATLMTSIELNANIGGGTINISNNTVNGLVHNDTGSSLSQGILVSASSAASVITINGNNVSNVMCGAGTGFSAKPQGIVFSTATASGASISGNSVSNIFNRQTGTGGVYGINLTTGTNVLLSNNFIWNINEDMTGGAAFSSTFGALGIRIAGGTGHKVYNNTINLAGTYFGTGATGLLSACICMSSTSITGCDIRNNLLSNTMTGSTGSSASVCLSLPASGTSSMNLTCNNNAYYTGTVAGLHGIAHVDFTYAATPAGPTTYAGLYTPANFAAGSTSPTSNLRAYTSILSASGTNDNASFASTNAAPFVSSTNLHIDVTNTAGALPLYQTGATGTGVTTDIDGDARPTNPSMGADEFILNVCSGTPTAGTVTGASGCAGTSTTLALNGATTGVGISYQWATGPQGGPYTTLLGTTSTQSTGALAAGTYYYVCTLTCSNGGAQSTTPEFALVVKPVPTASASSNSPVCVGSTLNLTGTTDIGNSFSWTGPNGFTNTNQNPSIPTVTAAAAGTYNFTATLNGCSSTPVATTTVSVVNAPTLTSISASPNPTCFNGNSQLQVTGVANGAYAATSIPYAPVSGTGTSITSWTNGGDGTADDGFSAAIALPFNFIFNGASQSQIYVSSNGYITFQNTSGISSADARTAANMNGSTASPNGVVALCFADLIVSSGSVQTFTSGTAPNRVFVVAYNGVPFYNGVGGVTGQILLYENTGVIEVHVGSVTHGTSTSANALGIENLAGTIATIPAGRYTASAYDITAPEAWRFSSGSLTYAWSPATFLNATNIANPLASSINVASQAYSVDISNGACTATGNITVNTSAPITAATISGTLSFCTGGSTTLTAVPTDGAGPYTYLWSPGGETTAAITVSAGGNYSCQVTDNCGGSVNTGNATVTAKPVPTASASSNSPVCTGTALNLTGTTDIGNSFSWTGPNSFTSSSQSPQVSASATTAMAGTYIFTATLNGCSSTPSNTTVAVNVTPSAVTITPPSATICPGGSVGLTASGGVVANTLTSGAGASVTVGNTTGSTLGPNPMQIYYGGCKVQMMFRASELSTLGLVAGSPVSSIAINLTGADLTYALQNFRMKTQWSSSVTALTTTPVSTGWVTQFGPTSVSPVVGYNTFTLATPMTWNGTDNLLIEFNFSNSNGGTTGSTFNTATYDLGLSYTASTFYRVDNTAATTLDAYAMTMTNSYQGRNQVRIGSNTAANFVWSPGTGLNTTSGASVTASPGSTQTYTATSTINGCSSANMVTVTVPTVDDGDPCTADVCNSGVVTHTFQDADNDGTCDANDGCPNDPNKIAPGICGCGVSDVDTDMDGTADCNDGCPNDPNKTAPGICGCGVADTDSDMDGTADCNDGCPNDPNKIAPGACGCGVADTDTDGDGIADCNDNCPTLFGQIGDACNDGDPNTTLDVITNECVCAGQPVDCLGVPNGPALPGTSCDDNNACTINDVYNNSCVCVGTFQDSDNDGTCDANDGCPNDPNKIAPGICGCGTADTDTDNDGIADCNDNCPNLAGQQGDACNDGNACTINDVINASCQCVGTFQDTDGDGICDANDNCPTLFGQIGDACDDGDVCTINDVITNACVCAGTFQDTDGDGICDANDNCPTLFGQIGDACDDGNPNSINDAIDANCVCVGTIPSCPFNATTLTLTTDGDASQTTWDIVNSGTSTAVCSGGGYANSTTIVLNCCLPDGCYDLRVFDSFGDGINPGGFVLRDGNGNRVLDNANNGNTFTTLSKANTSFCVPLGTDALTAATCDIENATTTTLLQAQANPAVTAAYSASNSTTGYQFLVQNPNGGYSRRIFFSHAAPTVNYPPSTPANLRCTYFNLSNMSSAPTIPSFVLLNVSVRSRVNGVYAAFGPVCRLKIDPTANCATSQLTTVGMPVNPAASCGATVTYPGGTIYANTVTGANKYQFEFVRPGYLRRIAVATRSLQLTTWVTNPLQCGLTYDVRVRVSFDNGTTYCAFGAVCQVTTSCGTRPGREAVVDGSSSNATTLEMYPNPNREDKLFLKLNSFDAGVNTVSVDIYDSYGKRVMSKSIGVEGGMMNTVVDLDASMASGLYMVTITAGDYTTTQRLVIQR